MPNVYKDRGANNPPSSPNSAALMTSVPGAAVADHVIHKRALHSNAPSEDLTLFWAGTLKARLCAVTLEDGEVNFIDRDMGCEYMYVRRKFKYSMTDFS